jgi:hypothetical protein
MVVMMVVPWWLWWWCHGGYDGMVMIVDQWYRYTPTLADSSEINCTCSVEGVDEVQGDVISGSVIWTGGFVLFLPDFLLCCVGVISFDVDEILGVTTLLCMAAFGTDSGRGFWSKA